MQEQFLSAQGRACAKFRSILMWQSLLTAVALMLVLEGIIPFLYPGKWRNLVAMLAQISDRQLRIMGLVSMVLGVVILYLVN